MVLMLTINHITNIIIYLFAIVVGICSIFAPYTKNDSGNPVVNEYLYKECVDNICTSDGYQLSTQSTALYALYIIY